MHVDGCWQTLVAHDDRGRGSTARRHGLTLMQRHVSLNVPMQVCETGAYGLGAVGPATVEECRLVQGPQAMKHCPGANERWSKKELLVARAKQAALRRKQKGESSAESPKPAGLLARLLGR